jgi:hypothetical protein
LYDFNANAGDWWILDEYPESWGDTVKVIFTDSITINGHKRKRMEINNTSHLLSFGGSTIEGIGNWFNMFPAFDMAYEWPLRCYQDSILGLYSTGEAPTCETTSIGIEEIINKDKMLIYPNPFNEAFAINYNIPKESKKGVFELYDVYGRLVYTTSLSNNVNQLQVVASSLKSGIYVASFVVDGIMICTKKILKE